MSSVQILAHIKFLGVGVGNGEGHVDLQNIQFCDPGLGGRGLVGSSWGICKL